MSDSTADRRAGGLDEPAVLPPSYPPAVRPDFGAVTGPPVRIGPGATVPSSTGASVEPSVAPVEPADATPGEPSGEPSGERSEEPSIDPSAATSPAAAPASETSPSAASSPGPDVAEDAPAAPAPGLVPASSSPSTLTGGAVLGSVEAPRSEISPADATGDEPGGEPAPEDEHLRAHSHRDPEPARRRRWARPVVVTLSLALVAALGAGVYLAVLSTRWNDRSVAWETQSRDLGEKVANLTTDLAGMTSDLKNTRDQLATAQQRITELADEKAQVGDDRETQKIIASDIQAVAEAAVAVSSKLGDCVSAQNVLVGLLAAAPETQDPEAVQTALDQASTVCESAVDSYNSLQRDLARS